MILVVSESKQLDSRFESVVAALDCKVLHHYKPRVSYYHEESEKNRCVNIAVARNEVRKIALLCDVPFYLWLDSDVLPPFDVVDQLKSHNLDAVGGWFQCRASTLWCGGMWLNSDTFQPFVCPLPGLTPTGLLSMGCAMLKRDVLLKHHYNPGIDTLCRTTDGRVCHLADSGDFSKQLITNNIQPYLDGNVICRHLINETDQPTN